MDQKRQTQLQRLAHSISILRPDWNPKSIFTYLDKKQSHRPVRDLAIALVIVALDPASKLPSRVGEHGPWWEAVMVATGDAPRKLGITTRCPVHDYEEAHNCGNCRSEYLITGNWPAGTQHQESRKTA